MAKLKTMRRQGIGVVLMAASGFRQNWPDIQRQQGKAGKLTQLIRLRPNDFASGAPEPWLGEGA